MSARESVRESVYLFLSPFLFIYSFIHYATEAAHITLQTYKLKNSVKTQSIKNSKNTTQLHSVISPECMTLILLILWKSS